ALADGVAGWYRRATTGETTNPQLLRKVLPALNRLCAQLRCSPQLMTLGQEAKEPRAEAALELELTVSLRGQRAQERRSRNPVRTDHDFPKRKRGGHWICQSKVELFRREETLTHENFAEPPHLKSPPNRRSSKMGSSQTAHSIPLLQGGIRS